MIFVSNVYLCRCISHFFPSGFAINEVFDILPIRGELQPGQTEEVQFLFYGHSECKFQALAACEVQGGPEYDVCHA